MDPHGPNDSARAVRGRRAGRRLTRPEEPAPPEGLARPARPAPPEGLATTRGTRTTSATCTTSATSTTTEIRRTDVPRAGPGAAQRRAGQPGLHRLPRAPCGRPASRKPRIRNGKAPGRPPRVPRATPRRPWAPRTPEHPRAHPGARPGARSGAQRAHRRAEVRAGAAEGLTYQRIRFCLHFPAQPGLLVAVC
jgi:hypothetical protein